MSFIVKSTTEELESVAGITMVADIAKAIGLNSLLPEQPGLNTAIVSMFGLLAQGRSSFEEIALFRHCALFRKAFELAFVPAKETLRLYLEKASLTPGILDRLRHINRMLLKRITPTPVVVEHVRHYIPVDIDVSTMDNSDSHKEGVSRTYMGTDGYAPIFAYLGAEGYMLDCELRPGSQHSQKGTPAFLERLILQLDTLTYGDPLLFRLDGGNDSWDTMRQLSGKNRYFIIKHNLRRENRELWAQNAKALGTVTTPFPGTTVWTGTITKHHPKAEANASVLDQVFKYTERTIDKEGERLLVPDTDLEVWWTNLYESPETIISLYHDHGTSEQFHSELKYDLGVERLPSGKMRVNALLLTLAMLAFNTLRWIGQTAVASENLMPVRLDPATSPLRKRLRKVLSDLIMIGCKLVHHGRTWILKISQSNPWLPVFMRLHLKFSRL
ncbi:MAG: hypothetical protein SAMD01599839_05220 [Rectinema sp.]